MPNAKLIAIAGGVALVLSAIGYAAAKKAGVLPGANTFNPVSDENIFYRGLNEMLRKVSGNPVDTLGTAVYGATHGGSLDVTSPNNLVYSGLSSLGQWVTGSQNYTPGTWAVQWYSNSVGNEAVRPIQIVNGRAVREPDVEQQLMQFSPFQFGA